MDGNDAPAGARDRRVGRRREGDREAVRGGEIGRRPDDLDEGVGALGAVRFEDVGQLLGGAARVVHLVHEFAPRPPEEVLG
jgi:hypothetical protein